MFEPGDTLLLEGGLGAGKTTFVQFIAGNLEIGNDQYVSSPSFSLLHEYSGTLQVFHMDLYRLTDEDDVEAAGLLDYLEHHGLCLIEWPERLGTEKPDNYLLIEINIPDSEHRTLTLTACGPSWKKRHSKLISIVDQMNQQIA
ncbi:tRNA (adenosine(37)-N6)-threonylcarbamoyltransferase complex ATPase subunit type 1 TsaE [Desulfobulbus marinus]|nr:tRNA (adenosine(37)-N6)-threonylcarbamoyltransferase complex ATPase subunit type 1 TsaE [Desulfogranum marinum]